ncbi:MAG: aspartyl protease family protein, partial [Sphingomonadales bacterium]|nr:aspartyl protease family protein [Sphingomonadales bacterium]
MIARITALILLLSALPLQAAVVLPVERPWLGLPQVEARLNGRVTGRFIVDTAASETMLSDPIIAALGLSRGQPAEMTGTTGRAALERYRLAELALGRRVYGDLGAYSFPRLSAPVGADGLIGADILRRQPVEFDLPGNRLILHDRDPDIVRPAAGWLEVPASQRRNGFLIVEVRIGRLTLPALIDSGATQNFVNLPAARQLGLRVLPDSASRTAVTGASGHVQLMNQFDLSGFEIGGMRFGASRLGVVDLELFDSLGL